MTGREFSQRPFSFPRGTKVKVIYRKPGSKEQYEDVCCFYGIKPLFGNCSSDPEDFAPVFRAVSKNGGMSNRRPAFDSMIFRLIHAIDFADDDERMRVLVEQYGKKNILVCAECGSINIQQDAWVDANTNEYCGDNGENRDSHWCDNCGNDVRFTFMSEFEDKMDEWAQANDVEWDRNASYEQKRSVYNKARNAKDNDYD